MTAKEIDKVAATVSRLLLATSRSADYTNFLIMFNQFKSLILKKRPKNTKSKHLKTNDAKILHQIKV